MNYNATTTDQFMRSVLVDEFTIDEADNALTALSTLTSLFPDQYPASRTYARPDHQRGVKGAAGVRFVVYGEEGEERVLRVPRELLSTVQSAVGSVLTIERYAEAA